MARTIDMYFMLGMPVVKRGPAYTAIRLAEQMNRDDVHCRVFASINRWPKSDISVPVTTGYILNENLTNRLPHRIAGRFTYPLAEKRLVKAIKAKGGRPLVYGWGEISLALAHRLKDEGIPVVREKVNCGKYVAKTILDDAYGRLGVTPGHSITPALVEKEREELHLADAIFCPSPMVAKSLVAIGLPEERLIPTSYGWEPARFTGTDKALEPVDGPTFLFVGFACVRKGAHILLEAWKRAGIKGRLVLVGDIEPIIAERYADVLARPDVSYMKFTPNVGALYRSADWFIFPTLEEGGPQVTYEAAGNRVPAIVSEMGAGAFTRDGVDGHVVRSDDPDAWAEVIARLGPDRDTREHFAQNALEHSADFIWERVGERRRAALVERFG
ncbi:glycosyltransferase family 4 protein [Flavisphingomonas formosensis]|uniref:glycosyltransferase family 4 protein n=1 Tax=Flavisphingomonas formosensis TaxID=861534 RepID=UPI0012FC2B40|nr:glycosyltransferase family 4 protein [Sphingomonas formosensis]